MLVGSLLTLGMPVVNVMVPGGISHGAIARFQPSLLVRLDASRDERDWDVLLHPLSARTVEPATGSAPLISSCYLLIALSVMFP